MIKKYIQNTYTADIQIILKKDGRFERNVIFPHYVFNKLTGQVENDGYTEVDEELYERLKKDVCFNILVKKGKLVVKDEEPLKAGSFTQILEMKAHIKELEDENAALKAEVAELKGGKGDASTEAADDGLDKLKLDELKAKAKELGLDAEALTKKADVIALIRSANATEGADK
jgi:regulator of replication initiation timing